MNTKIFKYGFISFALVLSTTSCSDFLETEQRGVTTQEAFYKTDHDVSEALYAIYDKMQSSDLDTFEFKNILSDDAYAGGGSRGDNNQCEELDEFRFGSSNTTIRSMFTKYYQIIYAANILIKNVAPDSDVKKEAIAEAKAFRAYAYFELVTLWGTAPLVTEPLEAGEYAQPNSTIEALWGQIEKDLTEAIPDLKLKSQLSATMKGNISKGTAQSWLGKAYLYQKKYDEAAKMFDQVIDSKEYALNPDFSTITRKSSEFGIESVFEISYADDFSTITEGTSIGAYCGPRNECFDPGTSGISDAAWGWCDPRQGLYDAFVAAGDVVRRKGTVINEQELIDDYGGLYRDPTNAHPRYGSDGIVRIKYGSFVDETLGDDSYHTISGTNFRITRYADVLLMAAEAYNRKPSPDDTKALKYINEVRDRAKMPDLTSTGDKLFEDIKLERRLELAFEFVRYQDLIRWGDAENVLKDQGKRIPIDVDKYMDVPEAGFKSNNWLLPFPDTEINVNPNLVQNPGY